MKTYLAAAALAVALAQPAAAVTFPTLTTIYVGAGVEDDGSAADTGEATVIVCANVSGVTASLRIVVLNKEGTLLKSATTSILHGGSQTIATHGVVATVEDVTLLTPPTSGGVLNVESTQSGVFCNAKIVEADQLHFSGVIMPLVRVNPHPGTVE